MEPRTTSDQPVQEANKKDPKLIGILLVAAALIVLTLIVGFTQFKPDEKGREQATFSDVREFNKGQTASTGNLKVSVSNLTRNYVPADASQQAGEGKELVVVTTSVENTSKEALDIKATDFKLESNDELSYEPGFAKAPNSEFTAGSLAVGAKASGELVYKIKKDAQGLKLTYKGYDYNQTTKRNEYVTYKLAL